MSQSSKITQINSSDTKRRSASKSVKRVSKKTAKPQNKRISDEFYIYDQEVFIYRTTHSGDVWQMRMWIAGEKK
jgi:hypothetical protein